jgi:ABC-type uncharacterized transport system substrate-binding protein
MMDLVEILQSSAFPVLSLLSHRSKKLMKTVIPFALAALLLAVSFPTEAQETRIPRIAFLGGSTTSALSKRLEAFRQGLRELGYVEGESIVIEYRYGEGQQDRLPALGSDLVRIKIDVIVTGGPLSTRAAKEATTKIPIGAGESGQSDSMKKRSVGLVEWWSNGFLRNTPVLHYSLVPVFS